MSSAPIELSAIKIFATLQKYIQDVDVFPLHADAFIVNVDAYRELGGEADDERAFARIGIYFPASDHALPFIMDLTASGVAVCVGMQEMSFYHYEHLGRDETIVAERLFSILVGLSNGQLGMLFTMGDDEQTQALEITYRRQLDGPITPLLTYNYFQSEDELKDATLTTTLLANDADIPVVSVHIPTYKKFLEDSDNNAHQYNRKRFTNTSSPLTRQEWEKNVELYYAKKAEKIERTVDGWFGASSDMSLKAQFAHEYKRSMRLRHLSVVSVAMIAGLFVASEFFIATQLWGLATLVALLIGVLIWQREVIVTRYGYIAGMCAYVVAAAAAYGVLLYVENDILRWIVVLGLGAELLETLICDVVVLSRRMKRLHPKAKS